MKLGKTRKEFYQFLPCYNNSPAQRHCDARTRVVIEYVVCCKPAWEEHESDFAGCDMIISNNSFPSQPIRHKHCHSGDCCIVGNTREVCWLRLPLVLFQLTFFIHHPQPADHGFPKPQETHCIYQLINSLFFLEFVQSLLKHRVNFQHLRQPIVIAQLNYTWC